MADAHGTTIASETAVAMASARVDTLSSASHSPSHFAAPDCPRRRPACRICLTAAFTGAATGPCSVQRCTGKKLPNSKLRHRSEDEHDGRLGPKIRCRPDDGMDRPALPVLPSPADAPRLDLHRDGDHRGGAA